MKLLCYSLLLLLLAACGGASDMRFVDRNQVIFEGAPEPDPRTLFQSDVFELEKFIRTSEVAAPIDMIWVIDNSGSMSEEIAQVRNKFQSLVTAIGESTDLKVALISRKQGTLGLELPQGMVDAGHIQIDEFVSSTNALEMAAITICPATGNNFICGNKNFPSDKTRLQGELHGFFRDGSTKIIVVVTDDNASYVTDTSFLDLIQPHVDEVPHMFAFRGLRPSDGGQSKPGCSVARSGLAYDALAQMTGGKTYDICADDWSGSFDDLASTVIEYAGASFPLSRQMLNVISVFIDEKELSPDEWQINGNAIYIKGKYLQGGETLVINYDALE